jgi:hypothetical protein
MKYLLHLIIIIASASCLSAADQPAANPLFDELLNKGLAIPKVPPLKLPTPLLNDGMDAKARKAVIDKAADKLPVELFLKKSDNAPFTLKINSINDAQEKRRGQTLDLYFVAFGKLETVVKKNVIHQLFMQEGKQADGVQRVDYLSAEDLAQRKIKALDGAGIEERFASLDIAFLEKVSVSGITRNVQTRTPHGVTVAMQLDDRFANDKQYPNRWRAITRSADKADQLGPPQPYTGFAGYVCVTELAEPAGALFVEMHIAFHEPPEWFGGPNLLRSKLPVVIQENVRGFRRKIARD